MYGNESYKNCAKTAKPYQWSANVQFVNIDLNKMGLSPYVPNNVPDHHLESQPIRSTAASLPPPNESAKSKKLALTKWSRSEFVRLRTVSNFEPSTYDICSIESFPLNLEWNGNASIYAPSIPMVNLAQCTRNRAKCCRRWRDNGAFDGTSGSPRGCRIIVMKRFCYKLQKLALTVTVAVTTCTCHL